jgi:hypothetical protein
MILKFQLENLAFYSLFSLLTFHSRFNENFHAAQKAARTTIKASQITLASLFIFVNKVGVMP